MARDLNRILLIEDEPDIQAIARLALEAVGGFRVECRDSGAEAPAAVAAFQPDLILLDVMMPGLDGPATLQVLKEDPATAQLPVIFLTAKVSRQEQERYLGLGAIGVIPKPFDPMSLSREILELWESLGPG